MSTTLPHPSRNTLAAPLAALALGLAGGVTGALILADDDPVAFRSSPGPAKVALPTAAPPVPERVSSAPSVSTSSLAGTSERTAPVPERVAGAAVVKSQSSSPVPERISGAHKR